MSEREKAVREAMAMLVKVGLRLTGIGSITPEVHDQMLEEKPPTAWIDWQQENYPRLRYCGVLVEEWWRKRP